MAKYRKVSTHIWNDKNFRVFDDNEKLLFLFILTHPYLTSVGGMRTTLEGLAAELKWSFETLSKAFQKPMAKGMIWYDEEASCLVLPNFLKHNPPENPNVVKSWVKSFDELPECSIKYKLYQIVEDYVKTLPESFQKGFETLSKEFRKGMAKQEQEQEQEQDNNKCSSIEEHSSAAFAEDPPESENEAGSDSSQTPPCPQQKIIELYHRCLPELPPVREWNMSNQASLRARWREKPGRQNLIWWEEFFLEEVKTSDFLMGMAKEFQANLSWIVGPKNFGKILNGQYKNRGPRTGSRRGDSNAKACMEFLRESQGGDQDAG